MSLQDSIFDVQAALKGTLEEDFERIDDLRTGGSWDHMRRSGDRARKFLITPRNTEGAD